MTGDDHGNNGTAGRFDIYTANSAPGCSSSDWECVRATSYIYPATPISPTRRRAYAAKGFEIGVHVTTNCADYTPASLEANYVDDLGALRAGFPGLPAPRTNRTHCIAWSDYDTQPQVELAHGIRLDTNYYYWPDSWVNNVPGLFTGSGMPMRFAKVDGTLIDVYQATTQMTDESGQSYPLHMDTLLDRALGPEGYYGVFTANMHTDTAVHPGSQAIVASAQARGVPIVSAQQMLDWIDGRNASPSAIYVEWQPPSASRCRCGPGRRGIQAMVPAATPGGALTGILFAGVPVDYTLETIKGVSYARFAASAGSYQVRYGADTVPPAISALAVAPTATSAAVTWRTNEPATTRIAYGLTSTALVFTGSVAGLTTSHSITLTGLAGGTTYYYRVTSADALNNSASAPATAGTFTTTTVGATSVGDTTVSDFNAGTLDNSAYVESKSDGELLLLPALDAEFAGSQLPAGWSATPWSAGGTGGVSNGLLSADGARVGTDALFTPGRTLEFAATFSGDPFQHVGFGLTFNESLWAIFSTGPGGGLYARSNSGAGSTDTPLPTNLLGGPHRYRIDWTH